MKLAVAIVLPFIALAAGWSVSAVASSPSLASTTTTTSTGPTAVAFPPPTGGVPADWTQLEDDTDTIRISVPPAWTAVDLAVRHNADGTPLPWISATTDAAVFFPPEGTADTFGVPGVLFRAAPFVADTAQPLAASTFHNVCTAGPVQTYDDGVFVGHIQSFERCGGTGSRVVRVIANPAAQTFTADLLIQLTGLPDDAATLNGLLLSFLGA
jgi:hypothetical protein